MIFLSLILFVLSAAVRGASAGDPLEARQTSEATFNLFAYGHGISGLPVYYADGLAEIGDPSLSNATDVTPIHLTKSSENSSIWLAHPNVTDAGNATFTAKTMYLSNSSSKAVGFGASQDGAEVLTRVWSAYGHYVLLDVPGANFYAKSLGEEAGYSLLWSAHQFAGSDITPLSLRTIRPSTESVLGS